MGITRPDSYQFPTEIIPSALNHYKFIYLSTLG